MNDVALFQALDFIRIKMNMLIVAVKKIEHCVEILESKKLYEKLQFPSIGICWGSAEIAPFLGQFSVKIL